MKRPRPRGGVEELAAGPAAGACCAPPPRVAKTETEEAKSSAGCR